jgi:5-methylcytosine-specific restriction endonuclease McrA
MPNPFNPDDAVTFDQRLASQVKAELRLTKNKQKLVAKHKGLCVICGQPLDFDLETLQADHVIPKVKGGSDDAKNMQLIHQVCHQQKTNVERKNWTRKSSVLKSTKKSNEQ